MKYLLYALGEIILVVIGILLALKINTANGLRVDREKEQLYLKSYSDDLAANINELDRVIKKSSETFNAADSLLRFADGQIELNDLMTIQQLVGGSTSYTLYLSQEGTINDIIGSGDLGLIQDDSIRRSMVNWRANLKLLREYEDLGKDNQLQFINALLKETDFYKGMLRKPILDQQTAESLRSNRHFLNLLSGQIEYARILNDFYLEQKEQLTGLQSLLQETIVE